MIKVFNIYSACFLATTLVSFFIAFLSWQRKYVKGARELAFVMLAAGFGAFCLIFETSGSTVTEKIFWSKLEYIGGVSTPVFYLIFVLRFIGKDKFLSLKYYLLLFLIPAITLFLTLTNEKHNLIWTGFSPISEKTNLIEYYHGMGFWLAYIAYTYLILFWATSLLFYFIIRQKKVFRTQGVLIIIGGLCPWIASVMYITGYNLIPGLDLPPISIVLSGAIAAYAIYYFRFLDLVPIARETLVETLSDGILVLDGLNRIQDINEAALSFMGVHDKNIIGSQAEFSGASDVHLLNAAVSEETIDHIKISGAGETKTFRIIKKAIRSQPGSRLVVIRDITESTRAEEALKESETKYRLLVENSPDAIAIYVDGKIAFVNNECLRLMAAKSPEQLLGKSVMEFVHPDSHMLVNERMKQSASEEKVLPLTEEKFIRLDGSSVEVEVEAMQIRFDKKLAVQLIVRDITERKKVEKELIMARDKAEESDRLKSAFLANMSHEIRTPMNSILGFTNLLEAEDLSGEERKQYIEIIKEGGNRLLNIINDIIDVSKLESGQTGVSISSTNINEQMEFIYSLFRPEAEKKGIRFVFINSSSPEEAYIETDQEKVYAILTNLVKNAIKFTSEGIIEFGYKKKNDNLEFYVKDTGAGIRADQREFIFDRFRQGSDLLNRNYEGTGLGLSISKAYVELLGGTIWVESEYGKGSTFYFTIPWKVGTGSKLVIHNDLPADTDEHQIKNLKILIAEDDRYSTILLAEAVSIFGKIVLKVRTGIDAVNICRSNPDLDLILMDIKMPEMDGYEATRQIRQFNKEVIIIAQTAFALKGDKEKALNAGCNDYISKPIDRTVLRHLLKKYV